MNRLWFMRLRSIAGAALLFAVLFFVAVARMTAYPLFAQDCPQTRLSLGLQGQVTPGGFNRVRAGGGLNHPQLGEIPGGGLFTILNGPRCADGYLWWQVNYQGLIGWTAEGNAEIYFLAPLDDTSPDESTSGTLCPINAAPSPRLVTDAPAIVLPPNTVRMRDTAGLDGLVIRRIQPGDQFFVEAGPFCVDGYNWFQVTDEAITGYIPEGSGTTYFVEPVLPTTTPTRTRTPTPARTPSPTACPTRSAQAGCYRGH
jgi:hypothetical protein